jgi:hypothetical protein
MTFSNFLNATLYLNTQLVTSACEKSIWSMTATDRCNNSRSIDIRLPYDPTPANLTLSVAKDTFTQRGGLLTDIGLNITAFDVSCPDAVFPITLTVFSDEGYSPIDIRQDWRSKFAKVGGHQTCRVSPSVRPSVRPLALAGIEYNHMRLPCFCLLLHGRPRRFATLQAMSSVIRYSDALDLGNVDPWMARP